jgi:hypothetical protein
MIETLLLPLRSLKPRVDLDPSLPTSEHAICYLPMFSMCRSSSTHVAVEILARTTESNATDFLYFPCHFLRWPCLPPRLFFSEPISLQSRAADLSPPVSPADSSNEFDTLASKTGCFGQEGASGNLQPAEYELRRLFPVEILISTHEAGL